MKLRDRIREELLKKLQRKNEYGCVMLHLKIKSKDWDILKNGIDKNDLYTVEGDTSYGFENRPHVTVLFGIHVDVPDNEVEDIIKTFKISDIKLDKIGKFEIKEFDVLKFDVDSENLHEANKKLKKLPHTSDYPNYHPHVTIAYLKKGKIDKYIDKFSETNDFNIALDGIIYSKSDGSEKKYRL